MKRNLIVTIAAVCAALASARIHAADAQLPIPHLLGLYPCGVQQGGAAYLELYGENLDESRNLYFSNKGLRGEPFVGPLPQNSDTKTQRYRVVCDGAVPPGDYDIRFVGKLGLSNPRTFSVGDLKEFNETEPNNEKEQANRVELNSVVNGRVNAPEDVDWYVFHAAKDQRVLIECFAWRIDSRMDGVMWLHSADGKLMAASQDEDLSSEKRDPFIDFNAPADADYYLKITDFTYNGGNQYFYRLKFSTLPFVDYILPTAAKPGTTAKITFYGRNLPGGEKTDLTIHGRPIEKLTQDIVVPGDPDAATGLRYSALLRPPAGELAGMEVRVKSPQGVSNPKLLCFSDLPQILETEPNDTREKAQKIEPPCAVNGQFMKNDLDCYSVKAKKGETFHVTVFAARIGSPADPDLEVLNEKGDVANAAQDIGDNIGQLRFTTNNLDIRHVFTAGADGDFTLKLEHLYRQTQGGPQYVYRLEVEKTPEPDFELVCSPIHEIHVDSHEVYQGGRERFDILVFRTHGHNDPITVEAAHLPPGVTAEPCVIGPDVKWGTLIVSAAPDAPIGEGDFEVVGKSVIKVKDKDGKESEKTLVRHARAGTVIWDTVNTPALARMARSLVMAVREKAAFTLTAAPNTFKVKQGDTFDVNVALKRRPDMPNAVQLTGAGYQLPPGLEIPLTTVEKDKTDAKLSLKTEKIKPGLYSFTISGDAQVPVDKKNIRCVYPSNIVTLTVEPKEEKPKGK
jgi:hypothetical protein